MPAHSDEPLTKTTLNLYTDDLDFLRAYYGHGWSEQVRLVVHEATNSLRRAKPKRTIGDIA